MERLQKPRAPFLVLRLANPHAAAPRGSCPHVHGEGGEKPPSSWRSRRRCQWHGRGTVAGAGSWEPQELHVLWSLVLHKVMSLQGRGCFGVEREVSRRQASSQAWLRVACKEQSTGTGSPCSARTLRAIRAWIRRGTGSGFLGESVSHQRAQASLRWSCPQ